MKIKNRVCIAPMKFSDTKTADFLQPIMCGIGFDSLIVAGLITRANREADVRGFFIAALVVFLFLCVLDCLVILPRGKTFKTRSNGIRRMVDFTYKEVESVGYKELSANNYPITINWLWGKSHIVVDCSRSTKLPSKGNMYDACVHCGVADAPDLGVEAALRRLFKAHGAKLLSYSFEIDKDYSGAKFPAMKNLTACLRSWTEGEPTEQKEKFCEEIGALLDRQWSN